MTEILVKSLYYEKKPNRFELLQDVVITLSNGQEITIAAGYKTDFASVPRLLWGIVSTVGKHNLATLIHDWIYDNRIGTRKAADLEMLYWLRKSGVSDVKAYMMYVAVRIGGKSWWDREVKE